MPLSQSIYIEKSEPPSSNKIVCKLPLITNYKPHSSLLTHRLANDSFRDVIRLFLINPDKICPINSLQ